MTLLQSMQTAWRLRWPLLGTHLVATALTMALIAPLLSATVSAAVGLSGKSGLADFEIAGFLLTPIGFVAGLVVVSLILAAAVIEISVMLALIVSHRRGDRISIRRALGLVLARMPVLTPFAGWFLLRLLALVLPIAGILAALASAMIGDHDINYYLSFRPPEFTRFVAIAAIVVLLWLGPLVYFLLGWSMALPGVLFGGFGARGAFGQSAALVDGHRLGLLKILGGWVAIAFALSSLTSAIVFWLGSRLGTWAGDDLARVLHASLILLGVWGVFLAVVTTVNRGGFAALLADRAETFGLALEVPPSRSLGRMGAAGFALGAILLVVGALGLSDTLMNRIQGGHDVMTIAHRGAAGERPENTLAAMEKAIEDGADWLELDVQESADGRVIVTHDSDFMKIDNVPTKVWEVTESELAEIDAGSWFDPAFAGERVPLLSDVLELAKDRTKVLIELKYYGHDVRLEERVAEIVEAAGMEDQIAIMSLKPEGIEKMRALRPDWQVGLLAATAIGDLTERDVDFLAVQSSVATPGFLAHARDAGMPVMVWTVNDAAGMSRMMSRGVDGIITDFPGRVPEVQARREELSTPERLLFELGAVLGFDRSAEVFDAEDA